VVAAFMPLIGKVSKKVAPDVLANAVFLFLLVLAVTSGRQLIGQGPVLQSLSWLGEPLAI
jgi:hypothetical protein